MTNPIDRATIEFGMEMIPEGTVTNLGIVNVWESGVEVAHAVVTYNAANMAQINLEVEILNDGTVNYYSYATTAAATVDFVPTMKTYERQLLHTSPPGTAPIVDYYVDVALNGVYNSAGTDLAMGGPANSVWPIDVGPYLKGSQRLQGRVPEDYYITVGDFGNNTGRYAPDFWAIDTTQSFKILIDGNAPTLILDADTTTVLGAGEVSLFARQGFIRYSAADVGKSISATYNVLVES